ncbi:M14 family zinc carboxypeptidase [Fibrella aquatilis]|uniref:Zinc carboxypeptidase n=1 Tax=Fibrella aquatilis TaxID=2817059 RepID=A0A939G6U2_9BACT|nr:M14 family zinc carboxypeptidase [Fibrella aquatilis]MBO0932278.1 zinc carboxypeptidase [Fibrella aquatilis]
MRFCSLLRLLTLFASFTASAQVADSYYLPQTVQFNAAIPTPRQHLGYQVGEWHVSHDQLVGYMRRLDELSDRITLVEYGRTHEKRPLLLLTISSPQNQQNIDRLKAEHVALTDPTRSGSMDVTKMPAVVWMSYSVHGNEASGTNAALLAAYYLAAAQGPAIDSLLNESIILFDPCINPDGGNRFASWVNTHRSQNLVTDPSSREFSEAWPGGRTNHYWFDLNRDYLYQQHPESQGRMVKFHEWKPNLLTDHHEMGTNGTFFFQPGVPTRVHPLTPKRNIDLTTRFGQFQAEGLQAIGSAYYTQESYDDFYYGKGSTYPDVNGAVGILFEQASSRGHAQESSNGLLTFPFTIRNQFTATLSTLRAARAMRTDLLNFQRDHFKEVNQDAVKAYVFGGSNDRVRTWEMVNILRRNQVTVYELAKDEAVDGKTYTRGNAYVVPLSQPQHRLIRGMFEKRTTFQDSLFYDISAWSMPHCFNMPYAEVKAPVALGARVDANAFPKGQVTGSSNYAYLFTWDSYFAPRAAGELMRKGYRLKSASQQFAAQLPGQNNPTKFDYGTVQVIANGQDPAQLRTLLTTLAERDGVDFYAAGSGMTPEGIDLGSDNFKNMRQPKPLLVVGTGVNSTDAGEIWHLLDTRVNIPLSTVDMAQMGRVNLDKYNVLILVSGDYGNLPTDKIRQWVQNGGTLVTMTDAVKWASDNRLSTAKLRRVPADTVGTRPYADYERYTGAKAISGTIFQTRADLTHPLLYGYKDEMLSVFKDNNVFLEKGKDPFGAPLWYTPKPLISGYVAAPNERFIRDTPAIIVNNFGAGKVIAMADNPNFRAFWYGTNKLFLNALFFGNQIGSYGRGVSEEN